MGKAHGGHRGTGRIVEFLLLIGLPVVLHYLIPIRTLIRPPYSYLGAVVMALALALMNWASSEFRKAGTGFQLQGQETTLVTSGPFRYSRNPIYLGMLLWVLGLAMLLGSLVVFAFPVLLFVLANFDHSYGGAAPDGDHRRAIRRLQGGRQALAVRAVGPGP